MPHDAGSAGPNSTEVCRICLDMTLYMLPVETSQVISRLPEAIIKAKLENPSPSVSTNSLDQGDINFIFSAPVRLMSSASRKGGSYVQKNHLMHCCHNYMDSATALSLCDLCQHWVPQLRSGTIRGFRGESAHVHQDVQIELMLGTYSDICSKATCSGCRGVVSKLAETEQPERKLDASSIVSITLRRKVPWHGYAYGILEVTAYPPVEFHMFRTETVAPKLAKPIIDWASVRKQIGADDWQISPFRQGVSASTSTSTIGSSPIKSRQSMKPVEPASAISSGNFPCGFRLIDVSQWCVVEVAQSVSYIALSYIWGSAAQELIATTSNIKELETVGRLRLSDVPKLVKDSIQVCKALNIGFLWIDRLCIVQDDLQVKTAQLEAMGHIYRSAVITLVLLERLTSGSGLPGVTQPRKPQPSVQVGPVTILPDMVKARHVIDDSTWASRGWTYQEGFLAQRLLVFGNHMLYLIQASTGGMKTIRRAQTWQDGFMALLYRPIFCCSSLDGQDIAGEIRNQVTNYTLRELTFEGDILNAFLGILALCGPHHYGILHNRFDECMLWMPSAWMPSVWSSPLRPSTERNIFPSWSWISARRRINWIMTSETFVTLTSWFICDTSDKTVAPKLKKLEQWLRYATRRPKKDFLHMSHSAWVEGLVEEDGDISQVPGLDNHLVEEQIAIAVAAWFYLTEDDRHKKQPSNYLKSLWYQSQKPECARPRRFGSKDHGLGVSLNSRSREAIGRPWTDSSFFRYLLSLESQNGDSSQVNQAAAFCQSSASPDILPTSGPVLQSIIQQLSQPGRILAVTQELDVLLRPQLVEEGRHVFQAETVDKDAVELGLAHLPEVHAKRLSCFPRSDGLLLVTCIAMSVGTSGAMSGLNMSWLRHKNKEGKPRKELYHELKAFGHPMIQVMVISKEENGCSRRLGVGEVSVLPWAAAGPS